MATQKFWSQRLFERKDVVKISYEGIAKKCQTTTRSAKNYIKRLEDITGVPVDIVSTGPDRNETIVLRHPYDA